LKREIIQTADGSSSVFIPELNENYHSIHGAVQESMHVFIEAGLNQVKKDTIRIFEMGYGTGLNFLLTFLNTQNKTIYYHGIEAFPLESKVVTQLNFIEELNLSKDQAEVFVRFHSNENAFKIDKTFSVKKQQIKLHDFETNSHFDLIYFDAFAPEVQPGLWTLEVFQQMYKLLNPGGILTTYCAKGQVRRNMQYSGFEVERLPGPKGKREILRATKK
jgi:tRNA U34 5-methylaminomethyl-2-thiouridine-forming methyltransferase MnmC